jgi:large-conductance mechanosensitive channel
MFENIKNMWKNLSHLFNDFINFIIENRLTSLLLVAILGLAITSIVASLKTDIIEYYLNKLFKTSDNNLIMFLIAFVQFIITLALLYLIYKFLFSRIEKFKASKESFDDVSWKTNLLLELKTLNSNLSARK